MADTGERDVAEIFARELRSWVLGRGKNVRSWDELPPATRARYVSDAKRLMARLHTVGLRIGRVEE